MKYWKLFTPSLLVAAMWTTGCAKSEDSKPAATASKVTPAAEHTHGAGPNGGVVFDLGSRHAEFTVDHVKQQCTILVLGDDEKTPGPVTATEFVLITDETKTADGTVVPSMTVMMTPSDAADGKAATFVGTDPGIANVADFAGAVTGEIDGKPVAGSFSEVGGGHSHAHATPHDGVVAALKSGSGEEVGFAELKLHDDKGDLELWLAKDREITQPLDIPADSVIEVSFLDVPGKSATLRVRNNQQNEDEDGNANLRNGLTNYFIFPGDSGQDPSWLMGAEFKSRVKITFAADGKSYTSDEFVVVPHTHADGHTHSH